MSFCMMLAEEVYMSVELQVKVNTLKIESLVKSCKIYTLNNPII